MTLKRASKGEMYPNRAAWCARSELDTQRLMGTLNPSRFKTVPKGYGRYFTITTIEADLQEVLPTYINCTVSTLYSDKGSIDETNYLKKIKTASMVSKFKSQLHGIQIPWKGACIQLYSMEGESENFT